MSVAAQTPPASSPPSASATNPLGDEPLYRSERTLVTRSATAVGTVVLKRAIGAEAVRRLRHERAILQRLSGVEGVARPAPGDWGEDTLALIDDAGIPLAATLGAGRMPIDEVLALGLLLSRVLAGVHRCGVIHKDINPTNVLLVGPDRRPVLIDFNIAIGSAQDRALFANEGRFAGTLAYMPPEQTGRTGGTVDHRSDLYALGAVLYQLITGQPMFESDDVLDILQHQLTTVPAAPAVLVPGIPATLSELVMRLLEKEPDRRYQSAEGIAHDLERLAKSFAGGKADAFALRERDFAARLEPPERAVGRRQEMSVLESALAQARRGPGVCVLVSGAEGTGKTVLVNQLQPELAACHGWFVAGQFDAVHSERSSATVQALRALGRLLLSQPEEELTVLRQRMTAAMGSNIGAGMTRTPEFKLLLGDLWEGKTLNPLTAEKQVIRSIVDLLRSVASQERPLVMLLDDAQRAPEVSMRFVDTLLAARDELPGLVLVLAYRPEDIDENSPLTAGLKRWADLDTPPTQLTLGNLEPASVAELVGTMLRLPPAEARSLGAVLAERTQGNPHDTIELINSLRQAGLLQMGAQGWRWDKHEIRRFVGENDGVDLLTQRMSRLPPACQSLMQTLACLATEVPLSLLKAAADPSLGDVQTALAPALEDGLVVAGATGTGAFRFRNPRVEECIHTDLGEVGTRRLRAALARRLANIPGCERHAAQQYIEALPEIVEPAEKRRAAALLRETAHVTQVPNAEISERFAAAALAVLLTIEGPEDAEDVLSLLVLRHLLLFGLGRHDEADKVYATITARCTDPFLLAEPTGVQMHVLANRNQTDQSVALGLRILDQLGLPQPPDMDVAIGEGMRMLSAWAADLAENNDLTRAEADAPELMVLIKFIKRVLTPAFNYNKSIHTWLLLECHRLWVLHGPCSALLSSIGSLAVLMAAALKDYRGAHATARHAITIGETRGYEPATSIACLMSALSAGHWVDPIQDVLPLLMRARTGLIPIGESQYIATTYGVSIFLMIETSRTLDDASNEIEGSAAFEERTGHHSSGPVTSVYRQFVRAMRGETAELGSFDDDNFNEKAFVTLKGVYPSAPTMMHILRSMSALVFNQPAAMGHHASLALSSATTTPGFYASSLPYWCRGLALAEQLRATEDTGRAALLEEFNGCRAWLSQRAADAPANFLHMVCLLDAERAWAMHQPWLATEAYDRALTESGRHSRPWHRAAIGERAARFYFSQGLDHIGRSLLADAARGFEQWGASAKLAALMVEFPFLRSTMGGRRGVVSGQSTGVSSDAVDMMAILRASQALSSETSLASLNACVTNVLSAMCGATSVQMVVHPRETAGWFLATSLEPGNVPMTVEQAGDQGLLALSAFRYAERTRQPLLLEDAKSDPRFAGDLTLAPLRHCSMLLVPILKQGEMQAVLVLENRMRHSAFSADRLDAVKLIAGQLAVSLDNALLYGSLESKVAERTAALEEANQKLEQLSVTDALTGLANRRHFNQALDFEWERARRAGSSVGLAMIDIDQFKQYNDHYGHQGGDTCLQLVADAMKSDLRIGTDLIARYGGEEFVLLLRDSTLEATRIVAERVRAAVAARMEPHLQAVHGIVTISIGFASCVPTGDTTSAQCLEAADAALYRAKHGGRNQVAGPA
jgi:diguanylate cyclase (GGDEF)-like protein